MLLFVERDKAAIFRKHRQVQHQLQIELPHLEHPIFNHRDGGNLIKI